MTEVEARAFVESKLWPNGPTCPKCGLVGGHYRLDGESTRPGVHKCRACRLPFTVTVGTFLARSHIPLTKWLKAIAVIADSRSGISVSDLASTIGITTSSAWTMLTRIRTVSRRVPTLLSQLYVSRP